MVWDNLSINKPGLVYAILGGFTGLFMLCSSVIKERLYLGEPSVATFCGVIFGPHAANLIDPLTWGNVDEITLEFSRIAIVIQCFAFGVELPKAYIERHWRSLFYLLLPVTAFGWLITGLLIWVLFHRQLDWLDSLVCAACVTATDPVLASSVIGHGRFAKRVPRHLRDLLTAESGCNEGMTSPFFYLAVYLRRPELSGPQAVKYWVLFTLLYDCLLSAFFGLVLGYCARVAIRYAYTHNFIDRESFLVFYFVLALFCAGSGSLLGMNDSLISFSCGVGFSNDGWFKEKTEESDVSGVIDLLMNLTFFAYFGTIIPWEEFNSQTLETPAWKLVIVAISVLLVRRIPIVLALKALIPDLKTWREALFAGHFGPIGAGAVFTAIVASADVADTKTATNRSIAMIRPIAFFLVLTSIIVHGSSVTVYTLGKRINTINITVSHASTRDSESVNWLDRLPSIQARPRSNTSVYSADFFDLSAEDTEPPRAFLRRQKEDDVPIVSSRTRRLRRHRSSSQRSGGPMNPETLGISTQDSVLLRSESLRTSDLELETSHETQRGSDEQETPPLGPKRVGTQLLTVPKPPQQVIPKGRSGEEETIKPSKEMKII